MSTNPSPTILVVDDDHAMLTVLDLALREAGFQVILETDGDYGLDRLKTIRPDLVICDVMMPKMDGIEFFQLAKNLLDISTKEIPIFIMTALNRKPWFADLEAEGAVIIQKPFEIDQLIRLLKDMFDI